MGADTGIEWTDATWNPLRGCTRVSEGCRNCYAEGVAARFSGPGQPYEGLAAFVGAERLPRWTGRVALVEHILDQPLRWKKPRRIFVNSMSDLFHESVPDEWIDRVFAVMALAAQHTFQVLTKRPERMRKYLEADGEACERVLAAALQLPIPDPCTTFVGDSDRGVEGLANWPLPNVWLGTSIEDQATADERIPHLLDTPASKRFISAEPLLGPIDLATIDLDGHSEIWPLTGTPNCEDDEGNPLPDKPALDWVIVGGESGPNARPMHPDWARVLRDQCAQAHVPFFFKQWGAWSPLPSARAIQEASGSGTPTVAWPDGAIAHGTAMEHGGHGAQLYLATKKIAGHLLDGREHREFPQ